MKYTTLPNTDLKVGKICPNNYVHNNPVEEGLVYKAEDCVYSSAIDYSGQKGLIDSVVVFRIFDI